MRIMLFLIIGVLAFVGVGASVGHYLREPYNPGFLQFPTITALHVIPGGIYLALAPFQFIGAIRRRAIAVHRWIGRALSALALFVGASAFFIAIVIPFSGWPERIVNGFFAVFFVLAIVQGVRAIRAKNVAAHREWMIRAFAIGLAIATMRLIMVPTIIIVGEISNDQAALLSIIAFTVGFFLHWGVAEWWIRFTRPRTLPATTPSAENESTPRPLTS